MYEKTSYDQIYDEHIYIFSITSISKIFNLFDFELIDAIPQSTHGGSMRYYVQKTQSKKVSHNLKKVFKYEKKIEITNIKTIKNFVKSCIDSKKRIIKMHYFIKNFRN